MGRQLVGWGRTVEITTRGRRSGRAVTAVVGFIEEPDGSLLVAAGDPTTDWVLNLDADPVCRVTSGGRSWNALATRLDGASFAAAVAGLIVKYGTPAERLGSGPAFRLTRQDLAAAEVPSDE